MNWTDERVEALRKAWADGLSASLIAARIGGVTRNAVIGKLTRLGLPGRKPLSRRRYLRKARKPTPIAPPTRLSVVQDLVKDGLPIPPPAEFDVPRIATTDLESHHCRFPCIADVKAAERNAPIFCGLKPVPGLPYCEVHSARAYRPPEPRRRESNVIHLPVREPEVA